MSELLISDKVSGVAKEDILELHNKIDSFNKGNEDEEKFRSFRLSRGVYGQRQPGVQMIRIKLPYGKLTAHQLIRIADTADKYATNKNHATTRQDVQIHYVKLADSPKVWAELEDAGITLKEACGNTVRNVTASPVAGVDPNEPFDVTPYAHAFFAYFLRNPICQEMGRKFKVSFSSSTKDTAYSKIHDLGYIPKIKDGVKGFEVWVAGGLGSQPMEAQLLHDFIPTEQIIPTAEAIIRVFDRNGERASRGKARMKFLIKKIGMEAFLELVEKQKKAVINKTYPIDADSFEVSQANERTEFPEETPVNAEQYDRWFKSNVFEQKQEGFYGVFLRVPLGDIKNDVSRALAALVQEGYAADDIRVTVNQGYFLRFVRKEALVPLYNRLVELGLGKAGFDSTNDITACPGTDTCNLGIASSTGIALELERVMEEEYQHLIFNNDIKIKISGCMNACGQHNIANIGFQGMSIKKGAVVMPAMQVLLGGGFDDDGKFSIADKLVKLPAKKAPEAFKAILNDFAENSLEGECYNKYYRRQTAAEKMYFFNMLKPYTVFTEIPDDFLIDWGTNEEYVKAVGVGECAGVVLDLVGTLILDAKEKFAKAEKSMADGDWASAIYHSYNTFVVGAKAILTGEGVACNTQAVILQDFDTHLVEKGYIEFGGKSFEEVVTQLDVTEPSQEFVNSYYAQAKTFADQLTDLRTAQVAREEVEA